MTIAPERLLHHPGAMLLRDRCGTITATVVADHHFTGDLQVCKSLLGRLHTSAEGKNQVFFIAGAKSGFSGMENAQAR